MPDHSSSSQGGQCSFCLAASLITGWITFCSLSAKLTSQIPMATSRATPSHLMVMCQRRHSDAQGSQQIAHLSSLGGPTLQRS